MTIRPSAIAFRLTIWFLLLSLIPLAVVTVFVLDDVGRGIEQLTLEHRRSEAVLLSTMLSAYPSEEMAGILSERHPEDLEIVVVDDRGNYIQLPKGVDFGVTLTDDFAPSDVMRILSGESGAIWGEHIVGYAPVPFGAVLTVTPAGPVLSLQSGMRRRAQLQLAVGLLIMSVAAGIAVWIVVGHPVRRLTVAAAEVASGNLEISLDPTELTDEMRLLAEAFNKMTVDLKTHIGGLAEKVTELERAEEAIRTSEEYFRALIENAQDIIAILDDHGKILFVSPAVESILGYTATELYKSRALDLVSAADRDEIRALQLASATEARRFELKARHNDGTWRNLEAIGHNMLSVSEVGGVVLNLRDVTDRKSLEEQFRQAQKMEAIGQLAGGIAHDFNNLLVPILGYAEIAMGSDNADETTRNYLEQIKEAAERAADLTRQILAFSRSQVLETSATDLTAVIAQITQMISHLIGENIELKTFLAPDIHVVRTDTGQIEQLLMNLSVNARDAMPNGGLLTIETENTYLDETYVANHGENLVAGHYVMISVSDNGEGMDPDTRDRVFEPFFTTKPKGEGTGLGLATAFGIVQQHNGHLTVDSEKGTGTTFKIYLPAVEQAAGSDARDSVPPQSLRGSETILVVEDDSMVRKMVCQSLELYGYAVLEADGPREGLEQISDSSKEVDLLLSDVVMPGMNGRELYAAALEIRPGLRALFMSGYTDNVIVHHGVLEEGLNFLQKPFTSVVLATKVRQVFD